MQKPKSYPSGKTTTRKSMAKKMDPDNKGHMKKQPPARKK